MTISTWFLTLTMIFAMSIQNPMTILFGDHPGKNWASGHQKIPSPQHLENGWRQLNWHLHRRSPYNLSVRWSILSRRRRMNESLRHWHRRRYPMKRLNDWIQPLMYIFSRGRIQTKPVSNWLHGTLEICGDISTLLTMWQASSSAQNHTTPRQPGH